MFDEIYGKAKNFDNCRDIAEVEIGEYDGEWPTLMYTVYSMPMLVTERDCVTKMRRKKLNETTIIYLNSSIESDKYPVREDRMRMEGFCFIEVKLEGSHCKETAYQMFDLKGMFPSSITNLIMTHSITSMKAS